MIQYTKVRRLLILLTLLFMLWPLAAYAQDNSYSDERLSSIQDVRKVTLSEEQKNRVISTCMDQAQKIRNLQSENDVAVRKRMVVYSDIQKELKALEIRITRQGADASELDLLIGNLDRQLNNFRELAQKHSNMSADLASVDCVNKPELFVAGLEELRDVRRQLLENAKYLKSTVINSPDSTFMPLIERLLI